MSDNIKTQDVEYTNEWVKWIEEAVDREYFKFYEYNQFNNIQHIGTGGFGKVYRANWKNSEKQFALKSFFSLDNITVKEIVRELKIQREVDFHDNIIRCYGITKLESDNHNNYWLVMEYADGGSLRSYLNKNFNGLSWNDKYNMAYQLSCAVSCLHNEGIVHRDLHSCNILVRNNIIKLADFGLSKRIGASSNFQSKLFGVVPYVDPKSFSRRRNNNNQMYSLDKRSDVYSIGVLLWELSSGKPPFYTEGDQYDIGLAVDISQGLREIIVPDTPEEYVKIYTKCWDGEPDNRPTMSQVVDWLNTLIIKADEVSSSTNNSELQGELSQLIRNFDKMDTKEIGSMAVSSKQENPSTEKDFNIIVDEINDFIFKLKNKGTKEELINKQVIEYFKDHNIDSQESYNWLLNNQISLNSNFVLGYFNYHGIVITQYFVGNCYRRGYGTMRNEKLGFEYYEKAKICISSQLEMGYCYGKGIGIKKDLRKSFYWYEKAANNGNMIAIFNLGHCYNNGIGTKTDKQRAFELYQNAANLGFDKAQNNLALMYENGDGIAEDIDKAIYWYKKSSEQGYELAKNNLKRLQKKIGSS
ncbi:kinase-like domain-containing protein [Rhizophagus clarus]|uniref:Kinase-like domain-containing protein n=1 Tax=Rhizophagus clarus TaxID=94130 RepID=A0A8H3MES3_9GLOM|nr:kinase-like domain-containing protein [Rhizophagus clarus]